MAVQVSALLMVALFASQPIINFTKFFITYLNQSQLKASHRLAFLIFYFAFFKVSFTVFIGIANPIPMFEMLLSGL